MMLTLRPFGVCQKYRSIMIASVVGDSLAMWHQRAQRSSQIARRLAGRAPPNAALRTHLPIRAGRRAGIRRHAGWLRIGDEPARTVAATTAAARVPVTAAP